ncbi:hypothetical protein N0V87_004873 [Didymella glomerata]|uniref:Uncharacterized protein n=1 Tax=Didymella glomerata TaxID=749621 RepID=A0A9W8WZN4_9PLEO|nr:hypothetical protein N0V87_004873 [Didymella glomerata]
MSFGTKILKTAFVTGQAELHPKDIDLRQEPQAVREALKGKQVPIIIWNQHMYDIPEPLLKVTSIHAADFVKKGKITLPDDAPTLEIDSRSVGVFVDYMKSLTQVRNPTPLRLQFDDNDIETHLGVCQVAKILGMEKYVDHLIRQADAIFHGLPSYEDLDYLVIHKAWYPRVYGIAVRTFARMVRDDEIPDPENFEKYLFQREEFANDIEKTNIKHFNWIEMQAKHKQREQERLMNKEAARAKAAELKKIDKERVAREKLFWTIKNTQDAKLRKATEQKTRASGNARKFTSEERTWYVKTNGKQPPKGC